MLSNLLIIYRFNEQTTSTLQLLKKNYDTFHIDCKFHLSSRVAPLATSISSSEGESPSDDRQSGHLGSSTVPATSLK